MDTPLSSTDFTGAELFTSLRYDPLLESDYAIPAEPVALADRKGSPFYMLDYHYERILEAAEFLQWTTVREVLPDTAAFKIKLLDDMRTHMIDQKPQKVRHITL
jgi:4-amino-4-deoxychorismate lyase